MDITSVADGLTFRGKVTAVKQTYFVFEASDNYMVMSFSTKKPRSGNFNVVDKREVRRIQKRFKGKRKVTSNAVAGRNNSEEARLAALNILYVLVATGAAKIESVGGPHRQLFFRVFNRA